MYLLLPPCVHAVMLQLGWLLPVYTLQLPASTCLLGSRSRARIDVSRNGMALMPSFWHAMQGCRSWCRPRRLARRRQLVRYCNSAAASSSQKRQTWLWSAAAWSSVFCCDTCGSYIATYIATQVSHSMPAWVHSSAVSSDAAVLPAVVTPQGPATPAPAPVPGYVTDGTVTAGMDRMSP